MLESRVVSLSSPPLGYLEMLGLMQAGARGVD